MICKFCSKPNNLLYQKLEDYYFETGLHSDYWECTSCHVIQSEYDKLKLDHAYSDYYTQKSIHNSKSYFKKSTFYLLSKLSKFKLIKAICERRPFLGATKYSFRQGSKVLDFGYGSGQKLEFYADIFDECHGYDLYPQNIERLRAKGIRIHKTLSSLPKHFDFIILDNVIEHVEDPLALLNFLMSLLRPNGTLVLITPNYHSIAHNILKKHWRGLESPRHICIFSKAYFQNLKIGNGIKILNNWRADRFIFKQARNKNLSPKIWKFIIYYAQRLTGGASSEMIVLISK